jgi:hypothetical protein
MEFFLVAALVSLGLLGGQAWAKSYLTQPQALSEAFPSETASVGRKTIFLSADQASAIEKLARAKVDSRVVSYYVAHDKKGVTGVAFFDRQNVRTMPMTFCVVVKPDGTLDRVELLSFDEPDDYLPPPRWLALYKAHKLGDDLGVGRAIPRITGASLTSQAVNDGVRRALATFQLAVKETL